MSMALHLASEHTAGAIASRMRITEGPAAGLANVSTYNDSRTRVVLMRRRPVGRSRHTRLHGLFSTGSTLTIFWTVLPLPPTLFGVDVRTYHLDPIDVEACLRADVWGHEILGYAPVLDGPSTEVLRRQRHLTADHFARPQALRNLLIDLCAPGSGIPELTSPGHTPATPSGQVLLTRLVAFPELSKMVRWNPTLRIRDNGLVIYSASASRIQELVLAGAPLGIRASNFAKDLDDPDDVLIAASRLYNQTLGSPYRWFQVAMNDARRLGVRVQ